ncbi:unnamed protein product [Nezara viridula]|uniref:Carboxylesterase type B domain-containing protein n=1 Tax=Nezara viridula TaxID=85310 RepID=A0A9P0MKK1_NEZVI|nr:unnamed protein product [Nezara viridula]
MLLQLLLLAVSCRAEVGPIVETSQGKVQGFITVSRSGRNYKVFAGIPYAKPPVGELRFKAPEAAEGWTDIRQAKEPGPLCPQINIYFGGSPTGEEDCLYLSVFTPEKDGKYPVAVHIHGGGWILDAPRSRGPQYLMDEDIVVVDFNWRIGILGFLSFEDDVVPGNMGLKDMVMALQWVKQNIANFGGDPDRVTLLGECVGGDAVYHLMVSPMSRGLFSKAIAESGSSYTTEAVAPPGLARQKAEEVARLFACKGSTSAEMVNCLRGKDALDLAAALPKFINWQIDPVLSFSPVLEMHSKEPALTAPMSTWKTAPVPLLTGITSGEGLLRTMFFTRDNFDVSELESDFNNKISKTLMLPELSSDGDNLMAKIRDYYFPGKNISTFDNFKNITDMIGDSWFSFGVLEGARLHTAPVYMYYFDYVGGHTISEFFGDKSRATGSFHTEEQIYIWEMDGLPPHAGKDLDMSRNLVKIWTKFIKDGSPTVAEVTKTEWKPYLPGENYMEITKSGFELKQGLITDRYNFWKSLNFRDKLM